VVASCPQGCDLPNSVGLVLGGSCWRGLPFRPQISADAGVDLQRFLPPLILRRPSTIAWPALRKDLPVVLTLATPGW